MADITMCDVVDCKLKETCYRFNAKVNEYRQTYFAEDPRKEDGSCEYYWKIENNIDKLNKNWED